MRKKWVLENEGLLVQLHDPVAWALAEVYKKGEFAHSGSVTYLCTSPHTAAEANEPGVGASWADVWCIFCIGTAGAPGAQGTPGGTLAWKGLYDAGTAYSTNDGVISSEGRAFYALQATTGNAPPSYPTTTSAYWSLFAERGTSGIQADGSVPMTGALTMTQIATPTEPAASKTAIYAKSDGKVYKFANGGAETEIGSGAGFWSDVPETPTRVSDSQFTITDASNANKYDKIFTKGTVIKWEKSGGGFQCAMIKAAAYGSNAVTIDILGNDLVAGFTAMKYCIHRAKEDVFIVPGTMPGNTATTDIGKTIYALCDLLVFAAQVRYKTAPTTTKGVWDINDDATSIFTTKPEIAAAATQGTEQISDCILDTALTVVAKDSAITLDYDSGHATTPGADAYVTIWWMPEAWRYLS